MEADDGFDDYNLTGLDLHGHQQLALQQPQYDMPNYEQWQTQP